MALIDVLIPVRNGAKFLPATFDSLAGQTLRDFRVLICDDGSTDDTPAIIAAERRFPVVAVTHSSSHGIARSLNHLIETALATTSGEPARYFARIDADDLCRHDRFERQVRFLEGHAEVGVVGSALQEIDPLGRLIGERRYPSDHDAIRFELLFSDPLAHPALLLRREVLADPAGRYDPGFDPAEDYELWCRLAGRVRFANIDETLVSYRRHVGAVGLARKQQQSEMMDRIRRDYVDSLHLPDESAPLLLQLLGLAPGAARPRAAAALQLLKLLDHAFDLRRGSPPALHRRDELALQLVALSAPGEKLLLLARDGRARQAYLRKKLDQLSGRESLRHAQTKARAANTRFAARLRRTIRELDGDCEPDFRIYGDGSPSDRVAFGRRTVIEHGCSLWLTASRAGNGGRLSAGDFFFLGFNSRLNVYADITIGSQVSIGANSYIASNNHAYFTRDLPIQAQGFVGAPVVIEDDVWIGCHVVILPGVTIGRGAIVGAGSIVTRDVPPYEVWAGNPARKLKNRPG
jgi:acetyltransferase-like isoleucine patch superfamily enzyme